MGVNLPVDNMWEDWSFEDSEEDDTPVEEIVLKLKILAIVKQSMVNT